MIDMRINGGSFKITDDNRTVASKNIANDIYNNCIIPDRYGDNEDNTKDSTRNSAYKPEIDIID